jgi:ribosome maturation factor RimP
MNILYSERVGLPTLSFVIRNFKSGGSMANKTEIRALELGEKIASEQNVYIVDVTYKKEDDGYSLCYYIDKENGIGIDECELFSKAVEEILDSEDFIENNYTLEVSSPGADRQLTKEREFLYYRGREVDVKLYKAENGLKEFTGVLTDYKDDTAVIDVDGTVMEIPVKQAVYIRLSFSF